MTSRKELLDMLYMEELRLKSAHTKEEVSLIHNRIQMTMHLIAQMDAGQWTPTPDKPKRKPRKKLTAREKFDKKNSRREAIMAQRARNG